MKAISVLVALLVAVAACSSPPPPAPELTEARTVDVDVLASLHPPSGMDIREFNDNQQLLIGPHYSFGLSWIATGQELHGADADGFGTQPVRALDGKQLMIVAVSSTVTRAPFPPALPVTAEVLVDGASTPLSGLSLAEIAANQP